MNRDCDILSVGVAALDAEHAELLALADRLEGALAGAHGLSGQAARDLASELAAYARDHFAAEERYMDETGHPGAEAHKAEHERFMQRVMTLVYTPQAAEADPRQTLAFLRQ